MSITAGSNLCAVARVCCVAASVSTLSNVKYNSVAMTSAGAARTSSVSNPSALQIFALPAPSTGSNLFTGSSSVSGTTIYLDMTGYTGADQTTPIRAGSYNSANTTSPFANLAVTSQSGDFVTTAATSTSGGELITGVTGGTIRSADSAGTTTFGSADSAGAASVTHSYTGTSAAADNLIAGFSIAQVSAGGGISYLSLLGAG